MKRKYETATCHIDEAWDGVPSDIRDRVTFVKDVKSTIKRAGHASGLMDMVMSEAKRKGRMLVLEPRAFDDGMTDDELVRWYERLGFTVFQPKSDTHPCLMRA
jgi:hypothetical protein